MMPWSPAPSSPWAAASNALRDVGRLFMQQGLDLGAFPVKTILLVADVADSLARQLLPDQRVVDGLWSARLAGDDDAVGCGKRFGRHAGLWLGSEESVDDGIGNAVADFIRMTFETDWK